MKSIDNLEVPLVLDCIKEASILFDKNQNQFSVKIPKEIIDIYHIEKKDKIRFTVEIREGKTVQGRFEIVKK